MTEQNKLSDIPASESHVEGWCPPQACDGKEQYAFEAWASESRYDMHEHPMHYIFMDPKTNAARMGWNAALQYVREQFAEANPPPETNVQGWEAAFNALSPEQQGKIKRCADRFGVPLIAAYYRAKDLDVIEDDPSPETNVTGIELAARFVEKRLNDYVQEHGSTDSDTGTVEFPGNGDEYVGELEEIIEGIRALATTEDQP